MDREIRNLIHGKQNRTLIRNGLPSVSEGSNGDIILSKTTDGVVLLVKFNNKWYKSVLQELGE